MMMLCLLAFALIQDTLLATAPISVPPFTDLQGAERRVPAPGAMATVVIFVTVDCPISNRYVPEMRRIADEYSKKNVSFLLAYVDPYIGREEVLKHQQEFQIKLPSVLDFKHHIVKALGATITPEAVLIGDDARIKYRGRIDNTYIEHGRPREVPSRRDLRIAIDEVLAGKQVSEPVTRSIGCDIPDIR